MMTLDDIFMKGVTPKSGEHAGARFRVVKIDGAGVSVVGWDDNSIVDEFNHGTYRIWERPKTIFDDDSIYVTWGALKHAMAENGLGDDTKFYVRDGIFGFSDATAKLGGSDNNRFVYFYG